MVTPPPWVRFRVVEGNLSRWVWQQPVWLSILNRLDKMIRSAANLDRIVRVYGYVTGTLLY